MLAMMVLFGHAYILGGFGADPLTTWSLGQTSANELAVQGFFILSGFLLSQSLANQPSLVRFAVRRFFRIMPAFWANLLVCALVIVPALFAYLCPGELTYRESITAGPCNALGFIFNNAFLYIRQWNIMPLFLHNAHPFAVNGSLWSLFYEALCYAVLALAAGAGWLHRRVFVLVAFAVLFVPCAIYVFWHFPSLRPTTPLCTILDFAFHPAGTRIALAFVAGVAAYRLTGGKVAWNGKHFLLCLFLLALSGTFGGFGIVWPFAWTYVLLSLAYRLPFGKLDRLGDVSYGVYLYAFVIQQCLYTLGGHRLGIALYVLVSAVLSVALGALSWVLVEKPAIALGQAVLKVRWRRATVCFSNPCPPRTSPSWTP